MSYTPNETRAVKVEGEWIIMKSPCFACKHLTHCQSNIKNPNPLPCYVDQTKPSRYGNCECCGGIFETKYKGRRFCSSVCRVKVWKRKQKVRV